MLKVLGKVRGKIVKGLVVFVSTVGVSVPAMADSFVTGVTIDTTPVLELAGIIVSAIGGIWAVKKVIKLANRS